MANSEHLAILIQGVEVWNRWREENPEIRPDLRGGSLWVVHADSAMMENVTFGGAYFGTAMVTDMYISGADFVAERMDSSTFTMRNDLQGINLSYADLRMANFRNANLSGANLRNADLSGASLLKTNLSSADLTGCRIYGISAWDVQLEEAEQKNLIITPLEDLVLPSPTLYPSPTFYPGKPEITVDDLEVAQFIYLLLNNQKIRNVIDTITSKAVLILGRFTPDRKAILEAIREMLRQKGYLPILFDFDKPASRDITETVSTLAHLSRFVIADITDAKSIPQELMAIVPSLPSVPFQPLILASQREYGMFEHFARFPWVLPVYHYADEESLLQSLKEKVIVPAEQKAQELAKR
jgi:hypothetical protein